MSNALAGGCVPDRDAIVAAALSGLQEGTTLSEIARKSNIALTTLHRWLLAEVPEQYRAAQHDGIVGKILEAGQNLESADSHLGVARAREQARFWQWIAERRLRAFAPKQEISGPGGGPIPIMDDTEIARRLAFAEALLKRRGQPIDVVAIAEPITPPEDVKVASPENTEPQLRRKPRGSGHGIAKRYGGKSEGGS